MDTFNMILDSKLSVEYVVLTIIQKGYFLDLSLPFRTVIIRF